MKYQYVTNYKNNDLLRQSFNNLTEKTYSFNFIDWYNQGFWGEKYIPYSLVNGTEVIANVSVNLMDFELDGIQKHYIQIGTVMTDKAYRGQGLSRFLLEKVIDEYKDKVDGIYLFANDSVLDFYPKFGFKIGHEYQYSKIVNSDQNSMDRSHLEHVNMSIKENRDKFFKTVSKCTYNERFAMNNFGLIGFWTTGPLVNNIYYDHEEEAYIIAKVKSGILWIYQIISMRKVNLDNIISAFGPIKKAYLGFTPYDPNGYQINEYHEENCTFFYLGKDLKVVESKKLIFPTLSHA